MVMLLCHGSNAYVRTHTNTTARHAGIRRCQWVAGIVERARALNRVVPVRGSRLRAVQSRSTHVFRGIGIADGQHFPRLAVIGDRSDRSERGMAQEHIVLRMPGFQKMTV